MTGVSVEDPWFEELAHGDVFDTAPATTLTDGAATAHAAIVGERLRLARDTTSAVR